MSDILIRIPKETKDKIAQDLHNKYAVGNLFGIGNLLAFSIIKTIEEGEGNMLFDYDRFPKELKDRFCI